ncbi:MAG: hypothetical protein RJA29_2424 [Pseudomonadota bacterium]
MPEYYFSPHTGEHIETATPADWMGRTATPPPVYDRATQSAFFRDGVWEVETAQPPAQPVPQSVTMRQARLALLGAGLLDDIEEAIASIPDPVQRRAAQIEWEYANTVERQSAFVQQMAVGLGLSAKQMDDLFVQAAAL